jgi:hypothetical protein
MIHYDRRLKVYTSDVAKGAWKTRLDAEAAELPCDLVDRALALADTPAVAVKAARLVVSGVVVADKQPDYYRVRSQSKPGLTYVVSLAEGCPCDAAWHGAICAHYVAALLVASSEQPATTVETVIDELYGQPEVVYDEAGRVFFGSK